MLRPPSVADEKADGLIYENEKSLETERRAISIVADKWGTDVVKLPRRYSIDFALLRGDQIKAWVEFKSRKNPRDKFPTYIFGLYKYRNLVSLSESTSIPAFMIVEWEDVMGYVQIPTEHKIIFSGTVKRGDWEDMEPMVEIPVSAFQIIDKK